MYESKWAGIVYGRSYHLDFRLIAIPEDFTSDETNWALEHIVPTTRAASKLSNHPRWCLFKSKSYCILGVTCMVRDLINDEGENGAENLTKDAQGRPLYIFVGYGTKINTRRYAINFPAYKDTNLEIFQPLYQYVRDRWLVKDSGINRKKTILTNYQRLSFTKIRPKRDSDPDLAELLNCQNKSPSKIFLWQNLSQWESKLWATAAICKQPTSLCLGSASKRHLLTSPFLNGTVADITEFTIQNRLTRNIESGQDRATKSIIKKNFLFPSSLEAKVKKDLQATFQQAGQAVNLGQELVQQIIGKHDEVDREEVKLESVTKEQEETFGFTKKNSTQQSQPQSSPENTEWF